VVTDGITTNDCRTVLNAVAGAAGATGTAFVGLVIKLDRFDITMITGPTRFAAA
jgi:hypothetical protein